MRTIIILRPTKDGKTQVTRKQLFYRFVQRGGKRMKDARVPLAGHPYHSKSDAELRYIIKDAGEAERANPESKSMWKYADQIHDAYSVLNYRRQNGLVNTSSADAKDLFIGNRGLSWEREDRFIDKAYTGDKRRVVINNHLPVRKAKDASSSELNECVTVARAAGFRKESSFGSGAEMGRPAKNPVKETSRREQGTGLSIEADGSWELVSADTLSTLAQGRGAASLASAIARLKN